MQASGAVHGLWQVYWSQHANLMQWHAATYQRRVVRAQLAADACEPSQIDADYIEVEFPCASGELAVVSAAETLGDGASQRPDIELLFCAIARLGPVAWCSFAPEIDPTSKRQQAVFRAQLSNGVAAATIGRDLQPFIGFSNGPSRFPVVPNSLSLRGGSLSNLAAELGHSSFQALFEVFGPCEVTLPRKRDDSPSALVVFTDSDAMLRALDAAAALRTLQVWLAFDWSLILTYTVDVTGSKAAPTVKIDESGKDNDDPPPLPTVPTVSNSTSGGSLQLAAPS